MPALEATSDPVAMDTQPPGGGGGSVIGSLEGRGMEGRGKLQLVQPSSADEEAKVVRELMNTADAGMKEGDTYNLVDARWWRAWSRYSGYSESENEAQEVNGRPPPIDNSSLVDREAQDRFGSAEPHLRLELQEEGDYVLVPQSVWRVLHSWYGGGPVVSRHVVHMGGREELSVEVYPLCLELSCVSAATSLPPRVESVTISKRATVGALRHRACELFGLQLENVRVWDNYGGKRHKVLSDERQALEDAELQMGNQILVEVGDNGQWPAQSVHLESSSPSSPSTPSRTAKPTNTSPFHTSSPAPTSAVASGAEPTAAVPSVSIAGGPLSHYSSAPAPPPGALFITSWPPNPTADGEEEAGGGAEGSTWSPVREMTDAEGAGGEDEGEGGVSDAAGSTFLGLGTPSRADANAAAAGGVGDVRGKLKADFPADVGPAKKPTSGISGISGISLTIAPPPSASSSSMAIVPVPSAEEKKGSGSGSGFGFRFGFGFGSSSSSKAAAAATASAGAGAGASQGIHGGPVGLTGLVNLGNTCFMNSALQCLVHTVPLVEYFMADYMREINRSNPLGMEGEMATAFGELLRKLWAPGRDPVAPRAFKARLSRFAPQFSGYNQHDSQELLAFLLDGLHEDLNRVMRKPYIEAKDADGRPDEEVARENWENHKARNDSIIVDKFQGQYKSTLVCPHCKKVSVTFDPFMYLSLPLPSKATRSLHLTLISSFGDQPPRNLTVTVPRTGRILDLQRALAEACQLPTGERLHIAEIYNNRIFRSFPPLEQISSIEDRDRLVAYRVPRGCDSPVIVTQRIKEVSTVTNDFFWRLHGAPLLLPVSRFDLRSGADLYRHVRCALRPFLRPGVPESSIHPAGDIAPAAAAAVGGVAGDSNGGTAVPDAGSAGGDAGGSTEDRDVQGKDDPMDESAGRGDACAGDAAAAAAAAAGEASGESEGGIETSARGSAGAVNAASTEGQGKDGQEGQGSETQASAAAEEPPFQLSVTRAHVETAADAIRIPDGTDLPKGFTPDMLSKDGLALLLDWSAKGLKEFYDVGQLEELPEVSSGSAGLPMKNKRQEGVTLFSCLDAFIKEEPLGPDDMWYCPQCKEHRQATKKLDLWRLPEILVVHLKRFSYSRYFKNKLDTLVTFPTHDFDLSPYLPPCSAEAGGNVYELYAISNHYGGMGGGHYTAYVQLGNERQWHCFDDSFVSPANESQIETPAAYVLFYRRVGSSHHYSASQNEAAGDGDGQSTPATEATDMDHDP
ncbi:hypothetical protein CLOM_g2470 [Closterium sp. NIES-68]|nr:hypothetical protein CLOM_g2470 [Closterium sp. NIES-68]GJP74340.1 hypothetical protein CLOP_g4936 [Closterium sp. NIES-67]